MKKVFYLFLLFALVFSVNKSVYAQADTVVVPQAIDGDPLGAINITILGDTTATGERNNPDRVYKLERDKIYFLNGTLSTNFDLHIIADKPDAEHKPAIIAQGVLADGKSLVVFVALGGNGTLENIYFQTSQPTGIGESTITIQQLKNDGKYLYDGCFFEWSVWLTIGTWATNTNTTIINSYFRNVENPTAEWNGRGISFQDRNQDSVIIVNNTFFNVNSFLLQGQRNLLKYVKFEHNTMVNSVKWPIQWEWQVNADFNHNVFYNIHSMGEFPRDKAGQDIDGLAFGIFNMEPLPLLYTDTLGYPEADREVSLRNNSWFFSSEVTDYWASIDTLEGEPFMNSRTQGMFDDPLNYPYLNEENTMNLDPGFVNAGSPAIMVQWIKDLRDPLVETSYWGYDPDGDRFGVTWPLPEDLSYTNAAMLTAADGGFPIGDLNWFPTQKAEWEAWVAGGSVTSPPVESIEVAQIEDVFYATWTVTPTHSPMDGVTGLGKGTVGTFGDMGVLVRMNSSGVVDARNGAGYEAENELTYEAGTTYKVEVIGNVATQTYNIDVTPTGGGAIRIGTDYGFRDSTPQDTLANLATVINELEAFGGVPGSRLNPSFMNGEFEIIFVNNETVEEQTTGTFDVSFDVTPTATGINGGFGFANGDVPVNGWGNFATIIRCNASNVFDARNGAAYAADNEVPYVPGTTYTINMSVDLGAKTYDVTVTPAGGSAVVLADDYGFRAALDTISTFSKQMVIGGAFGGSSGDIIITNNSLTDINIADNGVPTQFALSQNYPNPFNPSTVINYAIPKVTDVKVAIFNSLGQRVNTLVNQKQGVGNYSVDWNGKDNYGHSVSSGVYFYQIKAGDFVQTRKMMLMK